VEEEGEAGRGLIFVVVFLVFFGVEECEDDFGLRGFGFEEGGSDGFVGGDHLVGEFFVFGEFFDEPADEWGIIGGCGTEGDSWGIGIGGIGHGADSG